MNIILTGLRGSGKTSIGRVLAEKLKRPFIDLDEEIEKKSGKKIEDIVKKYGWEYFRKLEKEETLKAAQCKNYIIATGGGTLMDRENAQVLKNSGRVIFIYCDLKIIKDRLKKNKNRPSLTGKENFLDEMDEIWKKRQPIYEKVADIAIRCENKEAAKNAEHVIQELKTREHDKNIP